MKEKGRINRAAQFLLVAVALPVSIYAVSNLMPLLLHAARKGLNLVDSMSIAGYLVAEVIAMGILARAIYRLDRRAGRIRNRIEWFE